MFAYIGCRTTKHRNARGKGISVYDITPEGWHLLGITPILENPSYLAFDKNKYFLYTVHGDYEEVSAFKVEVDGSLTFLNSVSSEGKNPVYIEISPDNRFLYVATLQGGTVTTIPRLADGSLGKATSVAHIKGLSDDTVSLAHQCVLDKTGQWLLVPTQGRHIGHERIYVFKVNAETGELTEQSHIDARTYAEPRHLTISKDNRHVYVVNEKGNSVTYYDFDDAKGILTALQIIPSLPETYTGQGQASAVLLSPSEEFLYETNRIHESVAIYRVNKETGFLTNLGFTSVLGKTPRFFTFMPDGKQLLIANEDSDTLQLFDVDEEHGHLTFTGITVATASPTCVVFK